MTAPERPRKRRPSAGKTNLAAVAELADVSEATVSRVLNRKYGVAESTRHAVEEALKKVGYERPLDRELVLVLTPSLRNPIFAQQAERIENELSPHGLKTVICPVYPGTPQERDYVEALIDSGVAAIVFLSSSNTLTHADHQVTKLIQARGIPFVCVNGGFPSAPAPVVSTDDWRAAELAVAHLHDVGHRRIGLIAGPEGNIPADRRVEGFVAAMQRRGLPSAELVVRHHFNFEGGQQAGAALIGLGATGLVASSDEMALGAYRAAARAGLAVPGDVSIIGYDDSPLLDYTDPPLTTVRQPVDRIAENVGSLVTSLISGRAADNGEILIEPEIRLRGSTSLVRAR
jgi:LacI family transcriptional regulator, repressor for deo operon, udp, cdd, tsx, nupC, and nupG